MNAVSKLLLAIVVMIIVLLVSVTLLMMFKGGLEPIRLENEFQYSCGSFKFLVGCFNCEKEGKYSNENNMCGDAMSDLKTEFNGKTLLQICTQMGLSIEQCYIKCDC